jgi:glycosyltransferase involved in cell wall biosynthesis
VRLTALVERPGHVCCRYRVEAFRPYWESAGISLDVRPFAPHWWARLADWSRCTFDVVILQRRLLSPVDLRILRRRTRFLVFDFDDAVWLRDSYAARGPHSARRLRRFAAMVRAADAVVAGNPFLAAMANRFTPAERVGVIPTCVDATRYPIARHEGADVRLVWVGSASTLRGMQRFDAVLDEIGRLVPGVRLKIVCDRFFSLQHLPVDPCPWSETTETADIAAADIGIAWMPDDDWSRGKCGLKVLQYMAAGLPVIANPVGVHSEMVRPGETGFLAATADEWIAAVRTLAGDPELRRRMGAAGRQHVEHHYSVDCGAARWLELLTTAQRCAA